MALFTTDSLNRTTICACVRSSRKAVQANNAQMTQEWSAGRGTRTRQKMARARSPGAHQPQRRAACSRHLEFHWMSCTLAAHPVRTFRADGRPAVAARVSDGEPEECRRWRTLRSVSTLSRYGLDKVANASATSFSTASFWLCECACQSIAIRTTWHAH
jgi:hypothetical protein